jgi:hypothetical protein
METIAMLDKEVKRGSTEMLVLALVEDRPHFTRRRSIRYSTEWKNAA